MFGSLLICNYRPCCNHVHCISSYHFQHLHKWLLSCFSQSPIIRFFVIVVCVTTARTNPKECLALFPFVFLQKFVTSTRIRVSEYCQIYFKISLIVATPHCSYLQLSRTMALKYLIFDSS